MSIQNQELIYPMAFYVAGLATADWLTGAEPRGIYRWDYFPATQARTMANQCKRLAKLGTRIAPVSLSDTPTRSELKRARATALNNSFVTLSGIAGMQSAERFHNQTAHPLFHLMVNDIDRAARMLQPVAKSADMGTFLAFQILEDTMKFFQDSQVRSIVGDLADAVLRSGSLTDEDNWLGEFLLDLGDRRVTHPKTLVKWPKSTGKYSFVVNNPRPEIGERTGVDGGAL